MASTEDVVIRPTANYAPSLWGDRFLVYEELDDRVWLEQIVEDLKDGKKKEMEVALGDSSKHLDLLILINDIQRLGIDYYFEKEIAHALQQIYDTYGNQWKGGRTFLWFRLLRQQGFYVSCDIFNNYKDGEGSFKESLTHHVLGMLELYEAAYMRVKGEVVLDEALVFARTHLEKILKDPSRCNSSLSKHIEEALERPIQKRLPRLDALSYIPFYQENTSHKSLLRLAKLGFNLLQSLHKKELSQLSKWWKSFDVPKNLPYARDRLVECYFWALSICFEPQNSRARIFLAKLFQFITLIDDTFDAYGTYKELEVFNEAFQRWSMTYMDGLPDYMKPIYKGVLDTFEEMEDNLIKEGIQNRLNYVKAAMQEAINAYMIEEKWKHEGYVPTIEEYKSVALVSTANKMLFLATFVGMSDTVTDDSFKWALSNPLLIRASSVVCRTMDDIVGHKEEQQRKHVASTIQCYMNGDNAREEQVYNWCNTEVEEAWEDINNELLTCKDIPIPLIRCVINMSRVMDVLYKHQDSFTHVGEEFQHYIKSHFVDAMSI